jgi:hypothetical protein
LHNELHQILNLKDKTMQVVLNIKNPQDLTALMPLLERLGISMQVALNPPTKRKRKSIKNLEYHQAIIAKGGDASYFGDAAMWQSEERKERDLPFSQAPN